MSYTFGDTDLAAERLDRLAGTFESGSRTFLRHWRACLPEARFGVAVDLGCGRGHTTRLLADVFGGGRTVGLDSSAALLPGEPGFAVHDVTQVPFPCPRADVMYCRFLLTHLAGPARVVAGWLAQLTPGGSLGIEELQDMHAPDPAFTRYYEIVAAMQAAHGQAMYVGACLPGIATACGAGIVSDEVASYELPGNRMALLHWLNIRTWRDDAFVRDTYDQSEVEALEHDLGAVAAQPDAACTVTVDYKMRQMVLRP